MATTKSEWTATGQMFGVTTNKALGRVSSSKCHPGSFTFIPLLGSGADPPNPQDPCSTNRLSHMYSTEKDSAASDKQREPDETAAEAFAVTLPAPPTLTPFSLLLLLFLLPEEETVLWREEMT